MGWDQEDDNNGKAGPWGARPRGDRPGSAPPPPGGDKGPDLDDLLRQAQNNFSSTFGKSKRPGQAGGFGFLFLIALGLWLASGIYRVLPEENAVILTFGKWTETRTQAGLGYHMPWPIQDATKVNVAFERRVEIGVHNAPRTIADKDKPADTQNQMLTGDENIVDIDFVAMWRVNDAKNYLFEIRDPENTIKKVAESAMREIIGREPIQRTLTEGRADIEQRARELMQKILNDYKSGITVTGVQLLRADPPSPVVDAFDDVQRARADKERAKNEAETYQNDIVPRARGEAQKTLQEAGAYKQAIIDRATGDAARFSSVYRAYAAAPDVTRKRIYIETMQDVVANAKKLLSTGAQAPVVMPYFPFEGLKPATQEKKPEAPQ